ncbi:MAG TPA: MFS transporter [Pseudolabrys sp.]|nr:MFS transporter [Pseudolabrys sp.]
MAYFRNSVVNLLNLHYGIFAFVMNGAGAFFFVYLLQAGVPLPGVLVSVAALLLVRFAIRPAVVPLVVHCGLRRVVMIGAGLIALQLPLLAAVNGVGPALYLLIAVSALGDTVYWTAYHAYFAALGDHEHRGHQVSVREAIAAIVGIISPIVTAWLLVTFSPLAAFGASSVMALAAAIPLHWTPDVTVARGVPGAMRASLPGFKFFFIDGWIASGLFFVWQIALFVTLQRSFLGYGGTLAVAALVGAVSGLLIGRHIDAGGGVRAVALAAGALALVVLMRSVAFGDARLAVIANAAAPVAMCLYVPTLLTAVYNLSKRSPCPLRFQVASEGGWDLGGASASLIAAAMLWLGAPMTAALLLPLIGIFVAYLQLGRYYAQTNIIGIARHSKQN